MKVDALLVVGGNAVMIGTAKQVNQGRESRISAYRELYDVGLISQETFRRAVNGVTIVNLSQSPVVNK